MVFVGICIIVLLIMILGKFKRLLGGVLVLGAVGVSHAALFADPGQHNPYQNIREGDHKTGGPITVHVCPHSHDDVGWLKTVDEYFYGRKNKIAFTNVRVQLTSIMEALMANPERKFSEVEMKYFNMWWQEQTDEMKQNVRDLVKSG